MRKVWKAFGLLAALLVVVAGLSACGGGGDGSTAETTPAEGNGGDAGVSVDVGTQEIELSGEKPKIAMFAASGTLYQEASKQGAEETASRLGAEVTYFDSKFDPNLQQQQLQNALQDGGYDAWIIEAYGGPAACSLVSKEAPAKGIVVVQISVPTCTQAEKPAGEEFWTPGTLASVGGYSTKTYYDSFGRDVAKMIGPDAVVGVLNSTPAVTSSKLLKEGLEAAKIDIANEVSTNLTTPEGLAKTQTMLQANPDLNVIVSVYSDLTLGAINAISQAGKTGDIEVYDLGGNKPTVKAIEEGKQVMSAPYYPRSVAEKAVETLVEAFEGKPTERFDAAFPEGTPENPVVVTKENATAFEPQY